MDQQRRVSSPITRTPAAASAAPEPAPLTGDSPPSAAPATSRSLRRAGTAAVVGGLLFTLSVGAELLRDTSTEEGTTNLPLAMGYVLAWGGAFIALTASLVSMRAAGRGSASLLRRPGRLGLIVAIVGAVAHIAFAGQVMASVMSTGTVPDVFALWALGFLLLLVGQVLMGLGMRAAFPPYAWLFPVVSAGGIVLSMTALHHVGLFLFAGGWVGLGAVLLGRLPVRAPAH
jgi:hypothetical protein